MSADDRKARGKDKVRLPMPHSSHYHWSSQLFDLRAPSLTDVPGLLLNQPNDRARSAGLFKKTEWVDLMHLSFVLEPAGHYCGH